MKNFFQGLLISALVLVAFAGLINMFFMLGLVGYEHPQYGVPALVAVWLILAWGIATNGFKDPSRDWR